ncbi:hypothetical protein EV356DRAFT_498824 [Viridothelium virens]|uniref:Uncharacterized protein n=1 Tax=Viridothelium virens TaxID=1048519 RepID=A0A6A6GS85_VIRVR|nr:hypothetical protein EV356DRAFT_498824 [Viridothelium virens]
MLVINNQLAEEAQDVHLIKRSQNYDIYLFDGENCVKEESGYVCEGYEADSCCTPPTSQGSMPQYMTSANYHLMGEDKASDDHQIKVYGSRGGNPCGQIASQDDKCATGTTLGISGAQVYDGGTTPTGPSKKEKRTPTSRNSTDTVPKPADKVFFRKGTTVWTLPVSSELGKQFSHLNSTSQKEDFMRRHGTVKFQ